VPHPCLFPTALKATHLGKGCINIHAFSLKFCTINQEVAVVAEASRAVQKDKAIAELSNDCSTLGICTLQTGWLDHP
jgi:hypothetical protein